MINPLEGTIQQHLEHPEAPLHLQQRYGLVLRYGHTLWQKESIAAFRTAYTCNALLISIAENFSPMEITKNMRGIEANFIGAEEALEAALEVQKFLIQKQLPAAIVLYKGDGLITETKEWHCADSYVAEKLALCTPAMEIRLLTSFFRNFTPPEGIGVFQEKNMQKVHFEENIHLVRNYRE